MRKLKRRKVYALVDPIKHAIEGACVTSDTHLAQLSLREYAALDTIIRGKGTVSDWWDLANVLNLAETMANKGIGIEVLECCQKAQIALQAAAKRYEKLGKMGLDGQGIQAIRDLLEYHDLQRRSVSRSEYEKAIVDTTNRIKSKAPEVVEI